MKTKLNKGFTLIELLVVITIIAILASIAVPVYNNITKRANQTKALSNAKQIALGCKLFAIDEEGSMPGLVGTGSSTLKPSTSTEVFDTLYTEKYIPVEEIFWVNGDAPGSGKPVQDTMVEADWVSWAYATDTAGEVFTDNTSPLYPLILTQTDSGAWSTDPAAPGGIWEGNVIIVRLDYSGKVEKLRDISGTTGTVTDLEPGQTTPSDVLGWAGMTVLDPQ